MNYTKSASVCRAALNLDPLKLVRVGNVIYWARGRRLFSAATVNWLIVAGEAERIGDIVRALA